MDIRAPLRPDRGRHKPTMCQVALKAGVSATTVAHVLNNTEGTHVAQESRQRVLEAGAIVTTLVTESDPYDKRRTYEAVCALFAGPNGPTALVAADDAIAVMTCHALAGAEGA